MPDYLASIETDASGFADVVRAHDLGSPVPSCPGWDLRALAGHLGHVHRWARLCVETAASPDPARIEDPPQQQEEIARWIETGARELVSALDGLADDAPTWHPFPVPHVVGVWPRRQAHETAVHRWDAEAAVGPTTPLDPTLAADFVHEFFEVVVPRVIDRDGRTPPAGDTVVTLVDAAGSFAVRSTSGTVALIPTADAAREASTMTGSAESVLLALWRRSEGDVQTRGDVADAWLRFGGN